MEHIDTEIYESAPPDFSSRVEASGCYLKFNNKSLWLRRSPRKSEPGTWGVPGGKLEVGETPHQAALRELFEETTIALEPDQLCYITKLYICKTHLAYVYHLFVAQLDQQPSVRLSDENDDYKWVSLEELKALPLIGGTHEVLDLLAARRAF